MLILEEKGYMDIKRAIQLAKRELKTPRFEHTLRVIETSEELAERFKESAQKAKLAAALHDYAKNWSVEELKTYIVNHQLSNELLVYHPELWHGPVASHVMEMKYGITDPEVLRAIAHHTTGRAGMTNIEKIVYLADYIEPGRDIPGVEEVRKASEQNLDYACWLVARSTLNYLIQKNVTIHPDSFHAYNDLTRTIHMEGLLDGNERSRAVDRGSL